MSKVRFMLECAALSLCDPGTNLAKYSMIQTGQPCNDEQLAAWRTRRAQGTPKKRQGHRCARKARRRPSLRID